MRKSNVTLSFKNIISFLRNSTAHFTGKEKIITLSFLVLMLSFINITLCFSNNFVSALSYQSEVGIGFTFDPTLSISLSYSDLVISNLTPGTTSDSNGINISVATNSAYGYILTTSVGNSTIYNSTDLIHNNSNNIFSSIPTNTSLSSLEDSSDNNIWGYSYKLSSSNTWSNYSGLPLYNSPLKVLLNADSNDEINNAVDFKIATKASATQASGEYNNVINFSAVTKPTPTTLAEAYANYYSATNKTMRNGYYVMQDMADSHICENTEAIGSELQVIDIRDDKVYWIAKLADGKCWMTQNLDLDLIQDKVYTHIDTDLGWDSSNFDANASWFLNMSPDWSGRKYDPYFVDMGNKYVYTSNSAANDIVYDVLDGCIDAGHTDCAHYHIGNYYNWNAARADGGATASVCPAGWRLPSLDSNEFGNLLFSYGIINNSVSTVYLEGGFNNIRKRPLYFVRGGGKGDIASTDVLPGISEGTYFYNNTTLYAGYMNFKSNTVNPVFNNQYPTIQAYGFSIRCVAR